MTYEHSIRLVSILEALYQLACDAAETDDTIAACLDKFNAAKAAHRAAFGTLRKVEGEWA
tara:strand:- start:1690 stop:1869 length:180 start_codon:yes stop_codon:yes gene_type:complete